MNPDSPAEVCSALHAVLAEALGVPGLAFVDPPARLLGGCHTHVYGFRLQGAPPPYDGPLVVRILRPGEPVDVRFEAVLQDALIEVGLPVPCILAHGSDPVPLGGAYQVMERLPGQGMMLHGFDPAQPLRLSQFARGAASCAQLVFGSWPARLAAVHARLHAVPREALLAPLRAAGVSTAALGLGRLTARLERDVETHGLERLRPAVSWLRTHAPLRADATSLCHGDLFGNQVFEHAGRLAGVIDWSEAFLAPAGVDVGIVKAGVETVPLPVSGVLARRGQRVLRRLAERFVTAYAALRPLDERWVQYGEVLRCVRCLVGVAVRRRALAGDPAAGAPIPNPYDDPRGVAALRRHLVEVVSLRLDDDCVERAAA